MKHPSPRREKAIAEDLAKALALHQKGQLARAELCYRKILTLAPDHFDALHLLGVIEGQNNNLDESLDMLQRAVTLRPDNATVLNNLGNAFGLLMRHEEALAAVERSLAIKPDNAKALRNRGTSLRALKRPLEALASFQQALVLKPDFADAMVSCAETLLELHRRKEAIAFFHEALEYGKDVNLIRYALAALGDTQAPSAAPQDYVADLFDGYAGHFDAHLIDVLKYHTPDLLVQSLLRAAPATPADIIDLGCGTGLCGALLRPLARRLVGVDLSAGMLAKAREKGHYDELVQGEIAVYLSGQSQSYDIAIAADVFVYIGDLAEIFSRVRQALRPGGLFAFSVEASDGSDFVLRPSRRYAHSAAYIEHLAADQGMRSESMVPQVIREDGGGEVQGLLVVMRMP